MTVKNPKGRQESVATTADPIDRLRWQFRHAARPQSVQEIRVERFPDRGVIDLVSLTSPSAQPEGEIAAGPGVKEVPVSRTGFVSRRDGACVTHGLIQRLLAHGWTLASDIPSDQEEAGRVFSLAGLGLPPNPCMKVDTFVSLPGVSPAQAGMRDDKVTLELRGLYEALGGDFAQERPVLLEEGLALMQGGLQRLRDQFDQVREISRQHGDLQNVQIKGIEPTAVWSGEAHDLPTTPCPTRPESTLDTTTA